MTNKLKYLLSCGAVILFNSNTFGAIQAATGAIDTKIIVQSGCSMNVGSTIDFGTLSDGSINYDDVKSSAMNIRCSVGAAYKVKVNAPSLTKQFFYNGANYRKMYGGGIIDTLNPSNNKIIAYGTYKDSAASEKWGDSDNSSSDFGSYKSVVGNGGDQTHNIYVKLLATNNIQNYAVPAIYNDVITIMVEI